MAEPMWPTPSMVTFMVHLLCVERSRPGRERVCDGEADGGRAEADRKHLQAAAAPVTDEGDGGVGADTEQHQRAETDGHEHGRGAGEEEEGDERDEVAEQGCARDYDRAAHRVAGRDWLHVQH